ncbi:hypothetical protein NL676_019751 [Syzygium grande]|nr:hypothetical protein NL676_019751 [Syzygium grande]
MLLSIDYDLDWTVKPIKQGGFIVQLIVHALRLLYCKDSEERFWIRSRARFHSIAHAILAGFGHLTGKSAMAAAEGSSGDIKALRVGSNPFCRPSHSLRSASSPTH